MRRGRPPKDTPRLGNKVNLITSKKLNDDELERLDQEYQVKYKKQIEERDADAREWLAKQRKLDAEAKRKSSCAPRGP